MAGELTAISAAPHVVLCHNVMLPAAAGDVVVPHAVCQVDMMDRSAPAAGGTGGGADGTDAASAQLNSGASIGVRLSATPSAAWGTCPLSSMRRTPPRECSHQLRRTYAGARTQAHMAGSAREARNADRSAAQRSRCTHAGLGWAGLGWAGLGCTGGLPV
jgi:hypothetical protein